MALLAAPVSAASELFRTLRLDGIAGVLVPVGNLHGTLDPAPAAGLSATTSYYGPWKVQADLDYGRLDGESSPASLHYLKGGAALLRAHRSPWLPAAGFGVGLYLIRSSSRKEGAQLLLLDGAETEFGCYPRLRWEIPLRGRLSGGVDMAWDIVFSEPAYSHLPSLKAGFGWKLR